MRSPFFLGALVAALVGLAAWLVLRESAGEAGRAERAIAAADEEARRGEKLWLDRGDGRANGDAGRSDAEVSESVERREAGAAEAPQQGNATGFGVRVRVVDAEGSPLGGWPVVLPFFHPAWREWAKSEKSCAPARFSRNCGACHTMSTQPAPSWLPPELPQSFAGEPIAARAVSAAPHGEVFFHVDRASASGLSVRLEPVLDAAREIAVEPNDPPPIVELVVAEHELLAIRVLDEERWSFRMTLLRPWIDDGEISIRTSADPFVLRRGERFAAPYEVNALPRVEAWIERPFAPRLHLEPQSAPEGAQLALDIREHTCRASVRVLDTDGTPWNDAVLAARLHDGAATSESSLRTDGEGRLRFLLAAGLPPAGARGLTLARPGDGDAASHRVYDARRAAHLELDRAFSAGTEVDLGDVRFGDGPLLLSGRVVDALGKHIPAAIVRVHDLDAAIACDEFGRFDLRGFPTTASVALSGSAPGFSSWNSLRLQLPASNVDIVLHRSAALSMRVLAPEELLSVPLTLHVRQTQKRPEMQDWLLDLQAETFDLEGRVRIEDVPAMTLYLTLRAANVDLHEIAHEVSAGENEVSVLDLRPLIRPLRFRLATPPGEKRTADLQGLSELGTVFRETVIFEADGTLDLWVPNACRSWEIFVGEKGYAGAVDQQQPIELR